MQTDITHNNDYKINWRHDWEALIMQIMKKIWKIEAYSSHDVSYFDNFWNKISIVTFV